MKICFSCLYFNNVYRNYLGKDVTIQTDLEVEKAYHTRCYKTFSIEMELF